MYNSNNFCFTLSQKLYYCHGDEKAYSILIAAKIMRIEVEEHAMSNGDLKQCDVLKNGN